MGLLDNKKYQEGHRYAMLKMPVSFYLLAAISLECLHVFWQQLSPIWNHEVRLAVKYSLSYTDSTFLFKNGAWAVCQKEQYRNPLSGNSKHGNLSHCEEGAEIVNFWGICLYKRRCKEKPFPTALSKYKIWLGSYFCIVFGSNYITSLSAGRGRGSIWKESLVQIPQPTTHVW